MKKVAGLESGLNLPRHMAEHIYMFAGESINVSFRAERHLVGEIIDWYGKDVKFSNETDGMVDIRVSVNEQAFIFWALQYGQYVEVLEPPELRDKVKRAAIAIVENYM